MLYRKIKNFLWNNKYTIMMVLSLFLCATDASAETFGKLYGAGQTIFSGLRKVIYPAATIGIACVCIAGMFGSFNWKWFVAIVIGIFVIAYAEYTGALATGEEADLSGDY
jgi:type IV secretory pathway VirB2 component (pilin)